MFLYLCDLHYFLLQILRFVFASSASLEYISIFVFWNFASLLFEKRGDGGEKYEQFSTYFKILYGDVCAASNNISPFENEQQWIPP